MLHLNITWFHTICIQGGDVKLNGGPPTLHQLPSFILLTLNTQVHIIDCLRTIQHFFYQHNLATNTPTIQNTTSKKTTFPVHHEIFRPHNRSICITRGVVNVVKYPPSTKKNHLSPAESHVFRCIHATLNMQPGTYIAKLEVATLSG